MKALFHVHGRVFESQCAVYEVAELIWSMKGYRYQILYINLQKKNLISNCYTLNYQFWFKKEPKN
jgi:hypothetical protein